MSTDYPLGIDKVKRLDVSGLNEEEISALATMIEILRKGKQSQTLSYTKKEPIVFS